MYNLSIEQYDIYYYEYLLVIRVQECMIFLCPLLATAAMKYDKRKRVDYYHIIHCRYGIRVEVHSTNA